MKKIILIFGMPGTGKTTLAKLLSCETGYRFLSSEMIRSKMLNVNKVSEDCDFTIEEQDMVYEKMLLDAKRILLKCDGVILEGVFRSKKQRRIIYNLKQKIIDVKFYTFYIICDRKVAIERVRKRKEGVTISPAGVKTYNAIERIFESPNKNEKVMIINNTDNIKYSFENIKKALNYSEC